MIKYIGCFVLALVLSAFLFAPNVHFPLEKKEGERTSFLISFVSDAIYAMHADTGNYPEMFNWTEYLYDDLSNASGWNGPYLKVRFPAYDEWGNPLLYKLNPCDTDLDFAVYSIGENGIDECMSGDDIFLTTK